jgi:hypothetical protein
MTWQAVTPNLAALHDPAPSDERRGNHQRLELTYCRANDRSRPH